MRLLIVGTSGCFDGKIQGQTTGHARAIQRAVVGDGFHSTVLPEPHLLSLKGENLPRGTASLARGRTGQPWACGPRCRGSDTPPQAGPSGLCLTFFLFGPGSEAIPRPPFLILSWCRRFTCRWTHPHPLFLPPWCQPKFLPGSQILRIRSLFESSTPRFSLASYRIGKVATASAPFFWAPCP